MRIIRIPGPGEPLDFSAVSAPRKLFKSKMKTDVWALGVGIGTRLFRHEVTMKFMISDVSEPRFWMAKRATA